MLVPFFFKLREGGVPVSITEFLSLLQALQARVAGASAEDFYDLARACLADAARKGRGIAVCELVNRSPASVLQIGIGTLTMFAVTPFIRPFRWSRTLWDGVVSCLRAYDVGELRELSEGIGGEGYRWEIGRLPIPRTPAAITYLIGTPASA